MVAANVVLRMVHLKASGWDREEGGGAEIRTGWVLVCEGWSVLIGGTLSLARASIAVAVRMLRWTCVTSDMLVYLIHSVHFYPLTTCIIVFIQEATGPNEAGRQVNSINEVEIYCHQYSPVNKLTRSSTSADTVWSLMTPHVFNCPAL